MNRSIRKSTPWYISLRETEKVSNHSLERLSKERQRKMTKNSRSRSTLPEQLMLRTGVQPVKTTLLNQHVSKALSGNRLKAALSKMSQNLSFWHPKVAVCRRAHTSAWVHVIQPIPTTNSTQQNINWLNKQLCSFHQNHVHQIYLPWAFTKFTLIPTDYPGIDIWICHTRSVARRGSWAFCGSSEVLLQTSFIHGGDILITSCIGTTISG